MLGLDQISSDELRVMRDALLRYAQATIGRDRSIAERLAEWVPDFGNGHTYPLTLNDRQVEMLTGIYKQRTAAGGNPDLQSIAQSALNRGLRDEHDDSMVTAGLRSSPDFDFAAILRR